MNSWGIDLFQSFGDLYPSVFREGCQELVAECGVGWLPLIEEIVGLMHERNLYMTGSIGQLQAVREKLGSLRILITGSDAQIRAWVDSALERSMYTCEICGASGQLLASGGWQRTRCEDHQALSLVGLVTKS